MGFFRAVKGAALITTSVLAGMITLQTYQDANDQEHLILTGAEAFACLTTGIQGLIDLFHCCASREKKEETEPLLPYTQEDIPVASAPPLPDSEITEYGSTTYQAYGHNP